MFQVKKDKDRIIVSVQLAKRKISKDKKIKITKIDALKKAKEQYPNLNLELIQGFSEIADNRCNKLKAEWVFIVKTEQVKKTEPKRKKALTTKKKKVNVVNENKGESSFLSKVAQKQAQQKNSETE